MRLVTVVIASFGVALAAVPTHAQTREVRDESVAAAVVNATPNAAVSTVPIGNTMAVMVGDRVAFFILTADVNPLAGETVDRVATDAATRLQLAFAEVVESRNPARLLRAGLLSLGATVLFLSALWILLRLRRESLRRLNITAERELARRTGAAAVRATRVTELVGSVVSLTFMVVGLTFIYTWLAFVFRCFPYTRPWGESLRGTLIGTGQSVALVVLHSLPNLVSVLAIVLVTRFAVRIVGAFFTAVELGHISAPWLYPETAQPTRRIVTWLLWLLAVVIAYPLVPGSSSDAFKGVSVFAGLMISLGSSGIMNQVMSGFTSPTHEPCASGTSSRLATWRERCSSSACCR